MTRGMALGGLVALMSALWSGCAGIAPPVEKTARQGFQAVESAYRPRGQRPVLPELTTNSSLQDFLRFAVLNQPQVEAAYFDWAASIERITQARSLPDPRLTFQSDIADVVMSLVPGVMMDFPGPGKLKAAANVASAESEGKYFAFEASVLQTAFALKKSYYELHFLESKIAVNGQTLNLLADLERLARSQNEVGKVTLQDVLRAQIEQERLATEIANLDDSRNPLQAEFKAALGLGADARMPGLPREFESTALDLTSDQLFASALLRNPNLKAMEAEVRRAAASLQLAHKGRIPDFTLGLEADAKASPVMFTPLAGMTLPIWRDKIAAQISEAQNMKLAAEARLSKEQIGLAVEFAAKSFMYRESTRNFSLLRERLLPKARQSLEVARAAYLSGQLDFLNLIDAERTLLGFQLAEVEAQTQRELALAELSLLILGQMPPGAPAVSGGAPDWSRNSAPGSAAIEKPAGTGRGSKNISPPIGQR